MSLPENPPPLSFSFWRNVSPGGALGDLIDVIRDAGPKRWRVGLLAVGCTTLIFSPILREEHRIEPRLPQITYINSWRADRSDAEIRAGNLLFQRAQRKLDAEQARNEQEVKDLYKALGRASGMDVDAIERQAKAEAAADKARAAHAAHAALTPAPAPVHAP